MTPNMQVWDTAVSLLKAGDIEQGQKIFEVFLETVPREDKLSYLDKFEEIAEQSVQGLHQQASDQLQKLVDDHIRPLACEKTFAEIKPLIFYMQQQLPESSRSRFTELCIEAISEEKAGLTDRFSQAIVRGDEMEANRLRGFLLSEIQDPAARRQMEKNLDKLLVEQSIKEYQVIFSRVVLYMSI